MRRLNSNNLGPRGCMAFAEPLESNAGLKKLQSAALPLNPIAMHIESTPLPSTSPHPAVTAATPSIAPARLRLAANDIGAAGTVAIADAAEIMAWYDEIAWYCQRSTSRMGRRSK